MDTHVCLKSYYNSIKEMGKWDTGHGTPDMGNGDTGLLNVDGMEATRIKLGQKNKK